MSDFNNSLSILIENLKILFDFDKDFAFQKTSYALNDLYKNKGCLIFCGIGKSGHIGKKSAATFCSLGLKSYFLHPSEAVHGDLGIISKNDIVFFISNTGESSELLNVASYCNINNIKTISLTSNEFSSLSKSVKISIVMPKVKEIFDAMNVPTGSIINSIVIIDILSLYFAKNNGISNSVFKKFHPGGKIGSDLISVKDMYEKNESLLIDKDENISEFLKKSVSLKKTHFVVIENNNKILGIINNDLFVQNEINSDFLSKKVSNFISTDFSSVNFNIFKKDLESMVIESGSKNVILLDDSGSFYNILSKSDIYGKK